jgi:hypothetical protein
MLSLSVPTPRWKLKSKSDSPAMDSNLTLPHHRRNRAPKTLTGHRFAEPSFTGYNFTERGLTGYNLTGTASRGTASQPPEKNQTHPKTSEGQVHPTASSGLPCQPNVNAIRLSIHPEVLLLSHFEKGSAPLHRPRRQPHPTNNHRMRPPPRSRSVVQIQKSTSDSPAMASSSTLSLPRRNRAREHPRTVHR